MNNLKLVHIRWVISNVPDKEIVKELIKRNFKYEMFIDLGFCLEKQYKYDNTLYSIIVTTYGAVKIANYSNDGDSNLIELTLNKELTEDLLFILNNLKSTKEIDL